MFLGKLKLIYSRTPQYYNNYSTPTFVILLKKFLDPSPFKNERLCMVYKRLQRTDNKVITMIYDRTAKS